MIFFLGMELTLTTVKKISGLWLTVLLQAARPHQRELNWL